MAYVKGIAADFYEIKIAIEKAAVRAGWTLKLGVLSKNEMYFQLIKSEPDEYGKHAGLYLAGGIAGVFDNTNVTIANIIFPVTYEIYTFENPEELHCIMNYNSDYYQVLAFGQSDIPGIGGNGAWFTGSRTSDFYPFSSTEPNYNFWNYPEEKTSFPYWFESTGYRDEYSFAYCDLDGRAGWRSRSVIGVNYCSSLLTSLPNKHSKATVLLPVKAIEKRPNGGLTIIANPKNVRYCRIDNIVPEDIITYGHEQWKCYPLHRKNTIDRNSDKQRVHSGTLGFAIRYTGS